MNLKIGWESPFVSGRGWGRMGSLFAPAELSSAGIFGRKREYSMRTEVPTKRNRQPFLEQSRRRAMPTRAAISPRPQPSRRCRRYRRTEIASCLEQIEGHKQPEEVAP